MKRMPIHQIDPTGATEDQDTPRFNTITGQVEWAEGGGSGGGVQTIVAGTGIVVDSTDPANPIVAATGDGGGGGGGSTESYESVLGEIAASMVHRWKWEAGVDDQVQDVIGTLDLTLQGGYTRGLPGPQAGMTAVRFDGVDGNAVAGALGAIPVGTEDRCFIMLVRSTGKTQSAMGLFDYGAMSGGARWCSAFNEWSAPSVGVSNQGSQAVRGGTLASDTDWHLIAFGADSVSRYVAVDDAITVSNDAGVNTSTTGVFTVGSWQDPAHRIYFAGEIADLIVLDAMPDSDVLRRLAWSLGNGVAGGASAYDIALSEGFVGTKQEWLDSLNYQGSLLQYEIDDTTVEATVARNNTSGGAYAAMTWYVNLRNEIEFEKFVCDFFQADTYTFSIDGVTVDSNVVAAGATNVEFVPAAPIRLSPGLHLFKINPTASRRWHYRSGSTTVAPTGTGFLHVPTWYTWQEPGGSACAAGSMFFKGSALAPATMESVLLVAPDGGRWRLKVNNSGVLSTELEA